LKNLRFWMILVFTLFSVKGYAGGGKIVTAFSADFPSSHSLSFTDKIPAPPAPPFSAECNNRIYASDATMGEYFGTSVAISGNWAIVGAVGPGPVDWPAFNGAVYFFKYNETTKIWEERSKHVGPLDMRIDEYETTIFAGEVSLSGNWALVSAIGDNDKGTDAGAAYIYKYTESTDTWSLHKKLKAFNGVARQMFGGGRIFGDWMVVRGGPVVNSNLGKIYNYRYSEITDSWVFDSFFVEGGPSPLLPDNSFLISDIRDPGIGSGTGTVYVYDYSDVTGFWGFTTKLYPPAGEAVHYFGGGVRNVGDRILVGSWGGFPGFIRNGAAYLYRYSESTGTWDFETKFIANVFSNDDYFGHTIALSENLALVGAKGDDQNKGAAYVFKYSDLTQTWDLGTKLTLSNPRNQGSLGKRLALSGNIGLIGAPFDNFVGSVCFYDFSNL